YVVVVRICEVGVPLISVVGPGDFLLVERVTDVTQRRRRNGEDAFVGISDVGVRVSAITVESGIVVVEQVVVAGLAIGFDGSAEGLQIIDDWSHAGRSGIVAG